jgi:hypothetical protein
MWPFKKRNTQTKDEMERHPPLTPELAPIGVRILYEAPMGRLYDGVVHEWSSCHDYVRIDEEWLIARNHRLIQQLFRKEVIQ